MKLAVLLLVLLEATSHASVATGTGFSKWIELTQPFFEQNLLAPGVSEECRRDFSSSLKSAKNSEPWATQSKH